MGASTPLIFSGALIFVIFTALGFGGMELIVHAALRKILVLKEGSDVWNMWKTMPVPIYTRFRIFNVTNPEGLANGEKAILHEMGPYTYLQDWEKEDITVDPEDDTIRYRMTKTYFFQPELSAGSDDDVVTFINVILVASSHVASEIVQDEFMMSQMNDMLAEKNERLTKTATVRQILFDGVSFQAFVDLFNNPIVADMAADMGLYLPDNIKDGKFSLLKNKNGTDDGWLVVKSGLESPDQLGKIVSYNNETFLKHWRNDTCNSINGTDGTMFPPFLTRDSIVHIFSPPICRSFSAEYHSDQETQGLRTYRFIGSPKNFQAPKSNPDNWCFCKLQPNKTEVESCPIDGLFNIWPCTEGAPILASLPHFYGTEEWIKDGVEGLSPDFNKHNTMLDFHPLTGSPVEAWGRVQLSVELVQYYSMSLFANVRRAVVPILWIEEGSTLEGETLMGLQFIDGFINGFCYAKYIFMGIGIIMIIAGVVLLVLNGNKKKVMSPQPIVYGQDIEETSLDFGPTFTFTPNPE
ncbi:unnamed protein product [Allacma fusca]|uniref:Scavenger receptor class B member 1 n=1 Tax=Allacma fusca TaxID=39272 RepID=A0A8J2KTY6_9HEXA|nr:unnamed protein product [Allacma fusca]